MQEKCAHSSKRHPGLWATCISVVSAAGLLAGRSGVHRMGVTSLSPPTVQAAADRLGRMLIRPLQCPAIPSWKSSSNFLSIAPTFSAPVDAGQSAQHCSTEGGTYRDGSVFERDTCRALEHASPANFTDQVDPYNALAEPHVWGTTDLHLKAWNLTRPFHYAHTRPGDCTHYCNPGAV
jgi:hypothetical protein